MFNQEELINEFLITVNHVSFLFDFPGFSLFIMKMALAYTNYGDCRVVIQNSSIHYCSWYLKVYSPFMLALQIDRKSVV